MPMIDQKTNMETIAGQNSESDDCEKKTIDGKIICNVFIHVRSNTQLRIGELAVCFMERINKIGNCK